MDISPPSNCRFGDFEFDLERRALYFRGELVKVEKKALDVLAVLIREPGKLIPTQEIIDEVWADNLHGVTAVHLAQSIAKLRRAFSNHDANSSSIENVKGNGYVFTAETRLSESESREVIASPVQPSEPRRKSTQLRWMGFAIGGILFGGLLLGGWMFYPLTVDKDEEEVRRVVEESQRYESLALYRDPASFRESDLDKYWTAETDPGSNYDRRNIRTGVRKLIELGRYYGPETKNEQFEFQAVEINVNGDMAVVRTLERWFIAEYTNGGSLFRNKTVGPYFVSYVVRKIDDRWLIERSTTARATPPAPILEAIEPVAEVVASQQLFINISGSGLVPASVFLKVVGPGCPEELPCTVPNSALRMHSEISETRLANVPLTLASGEFLIQIQNGESAPSNSLPFVVP